MSTSGKPFEPAGPTSHDLSILRAQYGLLEEARAPSARIEDRVRLVARIAASLERLFVTSPRRRRRSTAPVAADPAEPASGGDLAAVRTGAQRLARALVDLLRSELVPELRRSGLDLLGWRDLHADQAAAARRYFAEMVFPLLTPLANDPSRPFPRISSPSLNLAVMVRQGRRERFARIKVPDALPRLVTLGSAPGGPDASAGAQAPRALLWIEELIAANADRFFPGFEIAGVHLFHVTRAGSPHAPAGDERPEEEHPRRLGPVTHLALSPDTSDAVRRLLVDKLEMDPLDAQTIDRPVALRGVGAALAAAGGWDDADPAGRGAPASGPSSG